MGRWLLKQDPAKLGRFMAEMTWYTGIPVEQLSRMSDARKKQAIFEALWKQQQMQQQGAVQ